jgi:hypothetical protein
LATNLSLGFVLIVTGECLPFYSVKTKPKDKLVAKVDPLGEVEGP